METVGKKKGNLSPQNLMKDWGVAIPNSARMTQNDQDRTSLSELSSRDLLIRKISIYLNFHRALLVAFPYLILHWFPAVLVVCI